MIFTPLFVKNFSLLLIFLIDSFGQFCMIVVLTSTNAISDYHHYNQWLTTTIWLSPLQSMTITTTISDYHHYNQWLSPLQSVAITTTISDYHHYNQWLSPLQSVTHHYNQWLSPLQSDSPLQSVTHHYNQWLSPLQLWGWFLLAVRWMQWRVHEFFIDLWQVCNFLLVLSVSSTNKTNCNNTGEILLKVALNTHIIPITSYVFEVLTLLRHQLLYG